MATITQRANGKWQAKVRPKGYPPQSKTFVTRRDAEAWARAIESEQDRGIFIQRSHAEKTTLREVIKLYSSEVVPTKKSQRASLSCLRGIDIDLGDYALAAITPQLLATYREKRLKIVDPQTVRKDLGMINRVLKAAHMDWGYILPGGIPEVRMPKQPRGRDRRASDAELNAIIGATESLELPTVIVLAVETAMRRSELLGLAWKDIELNKRVATLHDTKNGDKRRVPLSTKAVEALDSLPRRISGRVFGITEDACTRAFVRAAKRARTQYEANGGTDEEFLVGIRLHDLRHEATSRLFERGLQMMEVAAITGHKSLDMLKRYTHLNAEDLAAKLG